MLRRRRRSTSRPSRMESIDRQGPTLIRHDYGYKDTHPGGYSSITRFDTDRSDNPQPKANRIIRQANQREVDYMKGDLRYEQGGEVKGNGFSIKIPGQYAYEPIATTESGEQYVTMELPDGTMATVFGDWETYGNPNQQGYIEDLDYRIIPRGDGSYDLDAGEMESEMLRDEARGFARDTQGGPGATRMQDLLEKLSDRPGMGFTPEGRMRPIKRR